MDSNITAHITALFIGIDGVPRLHAASETFILLFGHELGVSVIKLLLL
ncbi:hypothetical protein [Nitrosomonas sp.]|nr:hypothetical protein [Nitrosomonas sp.]